MKVKELERTVTVAWSPANYHPVLLAAGTAAQQLDASFNTSSSLDLYSLNLNEPGLDLELKCSIPSPCRFHKVVWGGTGSGIVVGGCDGGKMNMYNVAKVTGGEDGLISHQDRHNGPVKALDFNPFQTNLLASGASDSDIFIWDLNNTSTPMSPGTKTQPFEDVVSLAWNKQVQHILASTFSTRCIVWDLRKNEPIIKLTDSNSRVRWKVVSWHPEVATQLCLASEDDSNPVLQLWDLRFATSPLRSLQAHTRGVLSLAWCTQDADLLMSSGKDNKIICWNPNADQPNGEIQCEISNTQQWIFELAWCPRNPNLIASCSADSKTSIYSLTGSQTPAQTSNKIADSFPGMDPLSVDHSATQQNNTVELVKPPKWMRKPAGSSFSFGGKLVSFGNGGNVTVSQVSTETELLERAREVQEIMKTGRAPELCKDRADSLWAYLAATFSAAPSQAFRDLLGYPQFSKTVNEISQLTEQISSLGQGDNLLMSNNVMDDTFAAINGTTHFDSNEPKESTTVKKSVKFKIPTSSEGEGAICKALLIGDIEGAVDICLQEKRYADALVLAMAAGTEVLSKTQQKYFNSFMAENSVEQIIRGVVTEDWMEVVQSCELISWKEALVSVLTYAKPTEIPMLCEELGKRLEEIGGEYARGAEVCYIAAGSIASLIRKRISESGNTSTKCMQELVELVMVGQAAADCHGKHIPTEGEISDLLTDYALIIASQGDYHTALAYLNDAQGDSVADLRERLYANIGLKQGYQPQQQSQPGYQQSYQNNQQSYQQPTPQRKFSGQYAAGNQFQKMSPTSAARTNAALGMQPDSSRQDLVPPVRPPSHPPPSPSPSTIQGGVAGSKKYVVDPSVGGGMSRNQPVFNSGSLYQPANYQQPAVPTSSAVFQPSGYQQQANFQPPSFQAQFQPSSFPPAQPQQTFQPTLTPATQQQPPPKNIGSAQNYHSGSPGWNDPPVLSSSSRSQKRMDSGVKAPITHPIFGSDPYQGGMLPPGVGQPGMGAPPAGPPLGHSSPGSVPLHGVPSVQSGMLPPAGQQAVGPVMQPGMPPIQSGMGPSGVPPVHPTVAALPHGAQPGALQAGVPPIVCPPLPGQMAPVVGQAQAYQQPTPSHVQVNGGYGDPPTPRHVASNKAPLPDNYKSMQECLEALRSTCYNTTNNAQAKRKLEDVARKLEFMYDSLREQRLSIETLGGLEEIVKLVDSGDYTGALGLHTRMVSGPDFSQISPFMPGLKVLIQSALQLNVYLH